MLSQDLKQFIISEKNAAMTFCADVQQWLKQDTENAVYLYGAGTHLQYVLLFFRNYHIPVKAILDSNKGSDGSRIQGIPLLRYADFLAEQPDPAHCRFFISAPSAADAIGNILREHFPQSSIDCFETQFYTQFIPDLNSYRTYLTSHWEELNRFSDNLADDFSRFTLDRVIRGRISGNSSYYAECGVENQYYPEDIISFSDHEVMVELGAYDGNTLLEFLAHCPKYRSVYCFEPEARLLPKLKAIRAQEAEKGNHVVIIPKGAWDKAETLRFLSDDSLLESGTLVMDNGCQTTVEIETDTVDACVPEPITYLKMDIEGAELRALHGSEKHIQASHPKLAVCVYHKPEDFLDIWNYLHKLVPEYHFYLRHHNQDRPMETVLYAITRNNGGVQI